MNIACSREKEFFIKSRSLFTLLISQKRSFVECHFKVLKKMDKDKRGIYSESC